MPDQGTSDQPPPKPEDNPFAKSPPTVPATEQNKVRPEPQGGSGNKEDAATKLDEELRGIQRGEKWIIIIQAFTAIVSFVIMLIYWGQLTQMRVATEASTKAAQSAADALDQSGGQFERMMRQVIHQTASQAVAASANMKSAEAAKGANDIASETLMRGQRPWIGVIGSPIIEEVQFNPDVGNKRGEIKLNLTFTLKNYGPSPALYINMFPIPTILTLKGTKKFSEMEYRIAEPMQSACWFAGQETRTHLMTGYLNGREEKFSASPRGFTIFPGDTATLTVPSPLDAPSDDFSHPLDIFGCIAYEDQFSKTTHHTRFCYSISDVKTASIGQKLPACPMNANAD